MAGLQCVACNRQIPDDSCDTCQCGHVVSRLKTIAGKRFSDYRADLYMRLVIEESKNETKKPTLARRRSGRLNQNENARNAGNIVKMKKGRRRRRLKLDNKVLTDKAATEFQQYLRQAQPETKQSSEHLSPQQSGNVRLTTSLEEINKRLLNQCGLWVSLASGIALGNKTS